MLYNIRFFGNDNNNNNRPWAAEQSRSVCDRSVWLLPQVENGGEYILETIDSLQKNSWVADIQDCIDPG